MAASGTTREIASSEVDHRLASGSAGGDGDSAASASSVISVWALIGPTGDVAASIHGHAHVCFEHNKLSPGAGTVGLVAKNAT